MSDSWLAERLVILIPLLLSLSVHEWAHAFAAYSLGDDTAEKLGRLTFNPIEHIDPVGTFLLPLLGVPFGWAKPVPFDSNRFRLNVSAAVGGSIVAIAGPVSNILLAAASGLALYSAIHFGALAVDHSSPMLALGTSMITINIALAAFNMIPIPPLDGSHIAEAYMPNCLRPAWNAVVAAGPVALLTILILPQLLGVHLFGWIYRVSALLFSAIGIIPG